MFFPNLSPTLERALSEQGYTTPTPVQLSVLEAASGERDLLVSAQTGSGKTVAYGLSMAQLLLVDDKLPQAGPPMGLIIAPTRELAMQVTRELAWLYKFTNARIASCIGGMDARKEARQLQQGCHIVVGTPGRLCDHLRRGRLDLSSLKVVVLDEADEMLDLGFRDELEELLSAIPEQHTTFMFSATLGKDIISLAKRYQNNALRIDVGKNASQHTDIDYQAMMVAPNEVGLAVVNILRYFDSQTTMVFCATRDLVRHMHSALLERGFSSVALSGDLGQAERTRAIESLRLHQARVCVATDVAARGLDLPALGLVIHASLPTNSATLLHRSGRTGRAGRKGVCAILVPANQQRKAERLLAGAKLSAQWGPVPSIQNIQKKDAERLVQLVQEPAPELSDTDTAFDPALVQQLLSRYSPEELARTIVSLYQAQLPVPEDIRPISAASNSFKPVTERKASNSRQRTSYRDHDKQDTDHAPTERDWFSIPVGRKNHADPKWLIPLLCKLGGIKKKDIGTIHIQESSTSFEISQNFSERFNNAVTFVDGNDVTISAINAPNIKKGRERSFKEKSFSEKKPFSGKGFSGKPSSGKPFAGKKGKTPQKTEKKSSRKKHSTP
ncbi:DEAD/DEAH box helicase [Entomobacter blattae]|uniref:ATP-dependent RNA helicase DeaD n=1 Tax=Entomobacter blattae TaxID=2762277 RepID=A0A7H1NQ46_9PROT|nr:DEAD/DEAH box helicase [Entomobacter blattae]QNT77906.1 ATP-dependent RNA helicase DeaD [Entomobacter blattae]